LLSSSIITENSFATTLPPQYDQLFPYHFKYCVETRYHQRGVSELPTDDIYGLKTGHTVFYINGIEIASHLTASGKQHLKIVSPNRMKQQSKRGLKKGVGFAVNAILKSPSFLMIPSFDDLLLNLLVEKLMEMRMISMKRPPLEIIKNWRKWQ
jgi:hypothetical protein